MLIKTRTALYWGFEHLVQKDNFSLEGVILKLWSLIRGIGPQNPVIAIASRRSIQTLCCGSLLSTNTKSCWTKTCGEMVEVSFRKTAGWKTAVHHGVYQIWDYMNRIQHVFHQKWNFHNFLTLPPSGWSTTTPNHWLNVTFHWARKAVVLKQLWRAVRTIIGSLLVFNMWHQNPSG